MDVKICIYVLMMLAIVTLEPVMGNRGQAKKQCRKQNNDHQKPCVTSDGGTGTCQPRKNDNSQLICQPVTTPTTPTNNCVDPCTTESGDSGVCQDGTCVGIFNNRMVEGEKK